MLWFIVLISSNCARNGLTEVKEGSRGARKASGDSIIQFTCGWWICPAAKHPTVFLHGHHRRSSHTDVDAGISLGPRLYSENWSEGHPTLFPTLQCIASRHVASHRIAYRRVASLCGVSHTKLIVDAPNLPQMITFIKATRLDSTLSGLIVPRRVPELPFRREASAKQVLVNPNGNSQSNGTLGR